MSTELSAAQKLEMVRNAVPRGLSAGDGGLGFERQAPQPMVSYEPYTMDTSVQEGNRTEPPPFTEESESSSGSGTSSLGAGAFNRLTVDDDGDTILQGGTVTGGNGGAHTFADYKVLDASTGPVETDGSILFVKVECEATVANGQMLPGCKVTTAGAHVWDTDASEVPDNHSFTTSAATGFLYYEVGRWTDTEFLPAAAGSNLRASGCIGDFLIRPLYTL
jgi:hypothetical protein